MTPNFEIRGVDSHGHIDNIRYNVLKFPSGEVQVALDVHRPLDYKLLLIYGNVLSSDHVMELLQINSILQPAECKVHLTMPYCAYSRQDRHMLPGNDDAFALKVFAQLINSCNFAKVTTWDNHSDVSTALIDNCTSVAVHDLFRSSRHKDNMLMDVERYNYFISPDAGANKKVFECSKRSHVPMIRADKTRDTATGHITGTEVYATPEKLNATRVLIIDDICAGGRTFTELTEAIRAIAPDCTVDLYVTHGFFSKGIDCLIDAGISHVYTTNSVCTVKHSRLTLI